MPALPHAVSDRLSDPYVDPAEDRSRLRFAAGMVGMGVLHFMIPGQFEKVVPRWFPWPREAVLWSGAAEAASGVLVAVPRTRRIGGWLAAATIVSVYPANIQMAVDATRNPKASKLAVAAAWLRLPMQFPMIARAFRFTR